MNSNKIDRVYLIGAGGIGSVLISPLARALIYHKRGTTDITLVEADKIEAKNIERQMFNSDHIGLNKAEALLTELHSTMPSLKYINEFVNKDITKDILLDDGGDKKLNVVITAVDNLATRHDVINALRECNENYALDFVFINCGNSYDSAHASIWAKVNNANYFSDPFRRYLEIAQPTDTIPGHCTEEAPSSPQLIAANNLAANFVLTYIQNLLDGEPVYEEVNGWLRRQLTKPLGQRKIIQF